MTSAAASSETPRTFHRLDRVRGRRRGGGRACSTSACAQRFVSQPRWDTFMYHLPFAALRGGLGIDYDLNELMRHRYEGFPFLPPPRAGPAVATQRYGEPLTGVVNFLAFGIFLAYTHFMLRARFWIVALVSLTAPLVVIHAACSYIDLFGNCFLAIATSSCLATGSVSATA